MICDLPQDSHPCQHFLLSWLILPGIRLKIDLLPSELAGFLAFTSGSPRQRPGPTSGYGGLSPELLISNEVTTPTSVRWSCLGWDMAIADRHSFARLWGSFPREHKQPHGAGHSG